MFAVALSAQAIQSSRQHARPVQVLNRRSANGCLPSRVGTAFNWQPHRHAYSAELYDALTCVPEDKLKRSPVSTAFSRRKRV